MGRIKFGVYKAPNTDGKEQQPCARLISKGTIKMKDVCEYLSDSSTLTSADLKGTVEALITYIGRELSNGYCVELEGLGHFSPALKTLQKTDENGQTIFCAKADGVNFRCSKRLKELVNRERPIKVKRKNCASSELSDRKGRMLRFLQNNPFINLTDYASLNSCSRYRASEDMKEFVKDGSVVKMGCKTHRVYSLPKEKGL